MNAARVLTGALAILLWATPAAAQDADAKATRADAVPDLALPDGHSPQPHGSPSTSRWQPIPPALQPQATGDHVKLSRIPLDNYTYWGLGVGGATGLAYSLASGYRPDSLEGVVTVIAGAGVGMYLGAAIDIVRFLRPPDK